ncbi:hypothetical protein DFH08DRAFT_796861 [Mycena albidolilacea]|uniref:Uncharacterized protein n=1 Tax=Mycena albidolilacea TaxID=1033008 RepID=A0AAD7AVZ5_9AGAR|nr:hypothetical protein DFH08DRAFT_796861 [Mycena albidolilacea]
MARDGPRDVLSTPADELQPDTVLYAQAPSEWTKMILAFPTRLEPIRIIAAQLVTSETGGTNERWRMLQGKIRDAGVELGAGIAAGMFDDKANLLNARSGRDRRKGGNCLGRGRGPPLPRYLACLPWTWIELSIGGYFKGEKLEWFDGPAASAANKRPMCPFQRIIQGTRLGDLKRFRGVGHAIQAEMQNIRGEMVPDRQKGRPSQQMHSSDGGQAQQPLQGIRVVKYHSGQMREPKVTDLDKRLCLEVSVPSDMSSVKNKFMNMSEEMRRGAQRLLELVIQTGSVFATGNADDLEEGTLGCA